MNRKQLKYLIGIVENILVLRSNLVNNFYEYVYVTKLVIKTFCLFRRMMKSQD